MKEWMNEWALHLTHASSWHYNYPELVFQYSSTISKTSLSLTHCTIKGLFVSLENFLKVRRQRSTSLCKVHEYTFSHFQGYIDYTITAFISTFLKLIFVRVSARSAIAESTKLFLLKVHFVLWLQILELCNQQGKSFRVWRVNYPKK